MTKSGVKYLVMIGGLTILIMAGVVTLAVSAGPDRGAAPAGELAGTTLKRAAVIDLPGPPGRRFDYLTIDYDDHYLFSAHLGAGLLYVIDLHTNTVVKTVTGVPGSALGLSTVRVLTFGSPAQMVRGVLGQHLFTVSSAME